VAGLQQINGVTTRQFCGPATAQATVNGQALRWSNGECVTTSSAFTVTIGKVVLGSDATATALKTQYDYFGVTVRGTTDGTYNQAIIAFGYEGQAYAIINNTDTVSGGLKQGTFSGSDLKGVSISGSFTC
jgi:hypothetical protein